MILFYDAEVFKYDWLFVIINPTTQEQHIFINDAKKLASFFEKHRDDIWVGYNSHHYDQYILKGVLCGFDPYDISKFIIDKDNQGWKYSELFQEIQLYGFDVMTTRNSLKELEGFMGHDIRETSVSFKINRKLTDEELEQVVKYCVHDVEETMEVFLKRKEEFYSHISLIKAFKLPLKYMNKTKAQLAATILKSNKINHSDDFDLDIPHTLCIEKYKQVVDWYSNVDNHSYAKYLDIDISGVSHVFAWGGLHGAREKYVAEGIIVNVDAVSFYPSLMLQYGFISRNVENPKLYEDIYNERIRLKKEKNQMQQPYKIVLNSTYGAMKYKYNNLYDPKQANCVCVAGQLLLLDLIEKLEPYWTLIQSNTDGLIGKVKSKEDLEKVQDICSQWEQRTMMKLDFDYYKKIYEKDVNNYILIDEQGNYKSKGAYVKKLSTIDNDLPIVNMAIKEYLINDVSVESTIMNCKELIMFQRVVKVSYKYSHFCYGDEILSERCIRIFASKDEVDKGIYKVKNLGNKEKVANAPERCFINNDNVIDKMAPEKLDKEWYVNLARKRIKDFLGGYIK